MAYSSESQSEEEWEDRTLNLLKGYQVHEESLEAKWRKKGRNRCNVPQDLTRTMDVPQVILELLDEDSRESALIRLSSYLIQKRKSEPKIYYHIGYLLYNSAATMAALLQEVLEFYEKMKKEEFDDRSITRINNVLTLFQCVAANKNTREMFVQGAIPSYLIPVIQFKSSTVALAFENVRALALSVVGILCQARDRSIMKWAIANNMAETCRISIEVGSELSKVIAVLILEEILQDTSGLEYICALKNSLLLNQLMQTWNHQVILLAANPDFSPRLLFHIVRCYFHLCRMNRGAEVVKSSLPRDILYKNETFYKAVKEYRSIVEVLDDLYKAVKT